MSQTQTAWPQEELCTELPDKHCYSHSCHRVNVPRINTLIHTAATEWPQLCLISPQLTVYWWCSCISLPSYWSSTLLNDCLFFFFCTPNGLHSMTKTFVANYCPCSPFHSNTLGCSVIGNKRKDSRPASGKLVICTVYIQSCRAAYLPS